MANDFINNVADKAKNAAEFAAKKTNVAVEQAKNKVKIMELNKKIEKAFIEIGELTYESSSSGEEITSRIESIITRINEYKEASASLTEANIALRGHVKCSSCGKENPLEASYCSGCGAALRE